MIPRCTRQGVPVLWRAVLVAAALAVVGGCQLGGSDPVKTSETILYQALRDDHASVRMLAMTAYRSLERDIPDAELEVLVGDPFAPSRFLAVLCKAEQAAGRGKQRRRDLSYFRQLNNKDEDASVRLAAVYGMALLDDMSHVQELAEVLADRRANAGARRNAAMLLGLLGNKSAAPMLAAYLRDGDPVVRMNAAEAMGRLGDTGGLELLRRMATTQGDDHQINAILALGEVGAVPKDVKFLRDAFRNEGEDSRPLSFAARLASYGARAMLGDYTQAGTLTELAARNPDSPKEPFDRKDKALILQLLARSAYGPSWRSVIESLDDSDLVIRTSAAWAMLAFDSAEGKRLKKTIDKSTASDRGVKMMTDDEILRPGSPEGQKPGETPRTGDPRTGPLGPIGPVQPKDLRVR